MATTTLKEAEIHHAIKSDCPQGQILSQRLTKLLGANYEDEHSLDELANFYQISVLNSGAALWQIRRRIKGWVSHGIIPPKEGLYNETPEAVVTGSGTPFLSLYRAYIDRKLFFISHILQIPWAS